MTKYSVQIGILRKKKGKKAIQMREDQYTGDSVAELQKLIVYYIKTFNVEEDEFTGGTLTQIEDGEYTQIGKLSYDGAVIIYKPISDSCIFCKVVSRGSIKKSPYDKDGKCSKCGNKVTIQKAPV